MHSFASAEETSRRTIRESWIGPHQMEHRSQKLTVKDGEVVSICFTVKNTGKRAGTEIAQVYASLPDSTGEPPKRLIGWTRVELAPSQSRQVSVSVPRDRLTVFDESADRWKLIPGSYLVQVGGSSQDLPLHQQVELQ